MLLHGPNLQTRSKWLLFARRGWRPTSFMLWTSPYTHTHTRFRLLLRAGCGRCDVFEMNWMAVDFWVAGVAKSFESGPLPPTTPCFLFTCEKYRRGAREKFNEFYDQLAITRTTLLNFAHLWLNHEGSKCGLIQFFNLISLCRNIQNIHYFKRWIKKLNQSFVTILHLRYTNDIMSEQLFCKWFIFIWHGKRVNNDLMRETDSTWSSLWQDENGKNKGRWIRIDIIVCSRNVMWYSANDNLTFPSEDIPTPYTK